MGDHKIEIGHVVRDVVSGMKGVATARVEYFGGATEIAIQAQALKDGPTQDLKWAPETRIEYVRDSEGEPVKVALPG